MCQNQILMAYTVYLKMVWLISAKNILFIFLVLTLSDTEKMTFKWSPVHSYSLF